MRKFHFLIVTVLLAQATLIAGQFRYRLIAKPGDTVGGQVITGATFPSVSGSSVAYRVSNSRVSYIVKDGVIVVKAGDKIQEEERVSKYTRAAISGSHLAFMGTSESGMSGIVLDGSFAVRNGSTIDGKQIGGISDFAMSGNRLAFAAKDVNNESRTWLFVDGRFVKEVVGEPALHECMVAYTTAPDGMQMFLNGDIVAKTRGVQTEITPTYIDGYELTWVGQPALSRNSFAFAARSEEGHVKPGNISMPGLFIVKDNHIIAKSGDTIDGIQIAAASDPSLSEDGSRIAFKVTYIDPVTKKSVEGIALGEEASVTGVAQFALGEGLSTSLTVINNGTETVSGNIAFLHQDGSPWLQLGSTTDQGAVFELQPGASKEVTGPAGGPVTVGHAIISSSGGPVDCFSTFAMTDGTKLVTTAAVLGHAPARALSLPVKADSDSQTGIAIANPGSDSANIKLTLVNRDGTVAKTASPASLNPLGPGKQLAAFLGEFFSDVKEFQGTLRIEVEGIGEVVATGIVVRQGLLSAVPVTRVSE